jgi:ribose transport system substrate-binding protein
MKRYMKVTVLVAIVLLLVPIVTFAAGNKVVFVIMGLNNPYVSAQAGYTEEWAKELGWDYTLFDGELDAVLNAKYLEDAITMNPDMIILMPIDSAAVSNGIKKAFDAGIPVLMEHMQALPEDEKYTVGYTGPGNYIQGQLAAEMFHEKLTEGGNIVEITCVPGQETTIGRHNGFVDRLKELNSKVELIASNNGDAQVDKTLAVMEDFLTRFGADGIDGIYACDDTMAVAAAIGLKEAGIEEGSIPIIGVGGSRGGLASIKSGAMYGTIVQSPKITQTQTAEVVERILNEGIKPPQQFDPYYMYVDHPKCTAENVEQFMPGDW